MEFRLLGPLEVLRDGVAVPLAGAKQRALLAILLLHANEVVARDTLLEELWPGRLDAGHSLDVQVSRLRAALAPAEPLVTRAGGYALEVEPERIDVHRFEGLLERARESEPAESLELLDEALALWRGRALADLAYEPFARTEAERLEELRLVAAEERIHAGLAIGRHHALVSELESLSARQPLRERLRAQLMLALYRSGRQAEALRVYAETRRRLVDELGLEPGPELQRLERAILRQDPTLDLVREEPRLRRRRHGPLAAVAVVLAAVAAAAGVLLARGGTQSSRAGAGPEPDSVALLGAASGKLVGQAAQRLPALMRFGEGALWSASFDGELYKLDPRTGAVLASAALPVTHPGGLAVGAGSVWVSDCCSPLLVRVDATQTFVVDRIPLPTRGVIDVTFTGEVAVGAGSLWVAHGSANPSFVERLGERTGRVQRRILIPAGGAAALAFGGGALWVAGAVPGFLSRIDTRTNEVTAVSSVEGSICCVAVGGGFTWVATRGDHAIWKLDREGRVVGSVHLTQDVADGGLTYADGAVWAAGGRAGAVDRIDPTTDAVRRYPVGHLVAGGAEQGGVVAAGVQRSGDDLIAGLRGRVVRIALAEDSIDSTDPPFAASFDPQQFQFQYATCAKLFNYPDAAGVAGTRLVPEVAAGPPQVTDGGRTYTFQIRPGYRFSPPSNELVTAESFRHAIERDLSPKIPGPWQLAQLADVVGAAAYHAGRAAYVSGVVARGDTLVIRLLRPASDLPVRLSLPAFCAVPASLGVAADGVEGPIPSAGPYYLAERLDNVAVLKPNPNYHGPRPHHVDALAYEWDVDPGAAAQLVAQGKLDYFSSENPAALPPETLAARRAGGRYRATSWNRVAALALNAGRPLFADPELRRAVQFAVDRTALASAVGALPTSHFLAPSQPGFGGEPRYPLRPDLRTARALSGHGRRQAVFALFADANGRIYSPELADALRRQLAAVGITLSVLAVPQGKSDAERARIRADADIAQIDADPSTTREPVEYLRSLPYLPPAAGTQLDRIAALPWPRRLAEGDTLAMKLERDGLYIGYGEYAIPELVSRRLGCLIDQPEYPGLDLAALCIRGT
jgi:DNA-binding SARP family transcriptional activator/ABC-type transport system substrate-binding protein/streptogramin lyase